ncbi:MAG: hypothetical protein IKH57_07865 [Clostridia bacterium]|nr:hypothetical protein [Clostridia bacterium]MBR6859991.1 hypothetical protein [Acidaminococcaceae bacterium]
MIRTRKKTILLTVLIVVILASGILTLTMRQDTKFDGDRISDPGHFALRFDRMNMTDSETIVLQEGDVLHVSWQIEKGFVDIMIGQKNEEVVYQANDRPAGDKADFYVEIPKTGAYTITVSAREAKGEIDFLKIESE